VTDGLRIAFVGNALPRRCGIATFTCDLELAMRHLPEVAQTAIIAMCDPGGQYAFPRKCDGRSRRMTVAAI
jgi:hypothetical protein